jgi:hypothetical protein
MAITHAGDSFRLESLPDDLWGMARMVNELRADDRNREGDSSVAMMGHRPPFPKRGEGPT